VSPEDDQLISIRRQVSVQLNGDFIALININFKAVILKLSLYLIYELLVRLEEIKLVNYGCLRSVV